MKKLIIFITFLSITSILFGQERVTFTTTKALGTSITLAINAATVDQPGVWIDLNNNGVRDNGEDVSKFGAWGTAGNVNYTIQSQTLTVYGKLTGFGAHGQLITSIDLTQAPHLTYLRVDNNNLTELDLSAQPKEFYNLHISRNQITSVLDLSRFEELQTVNIDRNRLTSIILGNNPKLGPSVNISQNRFSEEAIDAILAGLPTRSGAIGNFYAIESRLPQAEYEEGNQLKQHHLDHPAFTNRNWRILDVATGTNLLTDITTLTNRFRTTFTTAKSAGETITLNIDAAESDKGGVWIDLNNNTTRDAGETVNTFGSDVPYTISSPNIAVYGLASRVSLANNRITKADASNNPFLTNLNIASNNLTVDELNTFIGGLEDRTSKTPGILTLLDFSGDVNQATSDHISQANAKNWEVKDAEGRTLSPSDITALTQTIQSLSNTATYPGQVVTLPELTDQGLPITYSIESGKEAIATLAGNILTSHGYGMVSITATQAGNGFYAEFTKTITASVMTPGETFSWLNTPTIGIIGNNAFIAGSQEITAVFTRFYVNNTPVDMVEGNVDLSNYEGSLELKATSADGSQIIRLVIER